MSYRDVFQLYLVAAWHGVPFPITPRSPVQTDLRIENLIPIVDVLGLRWQGGTDRFGEWGLGFGVIGTRESVEADTHGEETSAFRLGPQVNLRFLGSFRVGLAYLVRHPLDEWKAYDKENLRIVIGADLLKLITGTELVFWATEGEPGINGVRDL